MTATAPNLQKHIADRLASFSEFGGIALLKQYEGKINARIDEALGAMQPGYQQGICLLIATPVAQDNAANVPTTRLDPFGVTITVVEDVIFNEPPQGSGRAAFDVAVLALRALKGWVPPHCQAPLTGWNNALRIGNAANDNRVMWHVSLRTRIDLTPLRLPGEFGYVAPQKE